MKIFFQYLLAFVLAFLAGCVIAGIPSQIWVGLLFACLPFILIAVVSLFSDK